MKASKVYAKAAELVDQRLPNWSYCCDAIGASAGWWSVEGSLLYRNGSLYEHAKKDFVDLFVCGNDFGPFEDANQKHRVLSLLLMSAIAADAETSVRRKPRKKDK